MMTAKELGRVHVTTNNYSSAQQIGNDGGDGNANIRQFQFETRIHSSLIYSSVEKRCLKPRNIRHINL